MEAAAVTKRARLRAETGANDDDNDANDDDDDDDDNPNNSDSSDNGVASLADAFGPSFLRRLVQSFASVRVDPRERDAMKITLHRVYTRLWERREMVRREMGVVLLDYAWGNANHPSDRCNRPHGVQGIVEMLEVSSLLYCLRQTRER